MTHTRKPLTYIAGPYSTGDQVENTRAAIQFAENIEKGFEVAVFIPHLSMLWHTVSPANWERWIERDLHYVERCDALIRMEGKSTGADAEVAFARKLRIPVFGIGSSSGDFAKWREEWKP